MTRRGSGWNASPGGVLYPRRGRGDSARPLILAFIVLATAAVAAFFIFRICSSDDCTDDYCPSGASIATPDGYARLSKILEWRGSADAAATADLSVSVPLDEQTDDGRNLSFFRYDATTQAWEPFAPAILDQGGRAVTARFNTAPEVVAVMRRLSAAGHVVAYLPQNASLHPDAAALVTIVHTRDFSVASDGGIIGTVADPRVIGLADGSQSVHYPSVYVDAGNQQSKAIISGVLSSSQTRTAHVQQIVQRTVEGNLPGIDIWYDNLPVTERTQFALFISELGQALHAQKKVLTVTLPAPIRQPDRVDEGAYDWAEIGRAADVLQMAVYRDQNTYRRDMPTILEYLTHSVPPSKIVLTVSPYATEKAPDGSLQSMSLVSAMGIASKLSIHVGTDQRVTTNSNVDVVATNIDRTQGRSGVTWDPQVASVAFTYDLNGGRTVWIENVFSIGFKLELIPRFGLGGVAIEDASANQLLGDIWPAIAPFVASGQPVLIQPNPDDLVPTWTVTDGVAEGGQKGVLTWSTPAKAGTYTITLGLSDGVARFENEIQVNVEEASRAGGTATPTTGAP